MAVPLQFLSAEERKQRELALREYFRGQEALADQPGAHLNMAVVFTELGDLSRAERCYLTALRIDPNFLLPAIISRFFTTVWAVRRKPKPNSVR